MGRMKLLHDNQQKESGPLQRQYWYKRKRKRRSGLVVTLMDGVGGDVDGPRISYLQGGNSTQQ
jgi:hypothetical protein